MMKLAVSYRRKALTFVSSVGVAGPLGIKETVQEDTLGTDLATEFPASGGYAYGYGTCLHANKFAPKAPRKGLVQYHLLSLAACPSGLVS